MPMCCETLCDAISGGPVRTILRPYSSPGLPTSVLSLAFCADERVGASFGRGLRGTHFPLVGPIFWTDDVELGRDRQGELRMSSAIVLQASCSAKGRTIRPVPSWRAVSLKLNGALGKRSGARSWKH